MLLIYIWGAGHYLQQVIDEIDQTKVKIEAILDHDEKKWGMNLFDKEVLPPEQAIKRFHNATYLIANERHCYDLQRQLLEHGIKKDKIFICRYGLA